MDDHKQTVPWEQRKTVRPREIAEYTGIGLSTIYTAIREGKLPARKISPKVIVVDVKDVDAWITSHETPRR